MADDPGPADRKPPLTPAPPRTRTTHDSAATHAAASPSSPPAPPAGAAGGSGPKRPQAEAAPVAFEDRPLTVARGPLLDALTCPCCGRVAREPHTIVECLHTFCRGCLDARWLVGHVAKGGGLRGLNQNLCPLCPHVVVGADPYETKKVLFDPLKFALVGKLFPELADAAAQEKVRDARLREQKREREAAEEQRKKSKRRGNPGVPQQRVERRPPPRPAPTGPPPRFAAAGPPPPRTPAAAAAGAGPPHIQFALHPEDPAAVTELQKPYLKMKPSLTAGAVLKYIGRKLEGDLKRPARDIHSSLSLWCHGVLISPGMTIEEMHRDVWAKTKAPDEKTMVIKYRVAGKVGEVAGVGPGAAGVAAPPPASTAAEMAA